MFGPAAGVGSQRQVYSATQPPVDGHARGVLKATAIRRAQIRVALSRTSRPPVCIHSLGSVHVKTGDGWAAAMPPPPSPRPPPYCAKTNGGPNIRTVRELF